jgi:hypothetical protein
MNPLNISANFRPNKRQVNSLQNRTLNLESGRHINILIRHKIMDINPIRIYNKSCNSTSKLFVLFGVFSNNPFLSL